MVTAHNALVTPWSRLDGIGMDDPPPAGVDIHVPDGRRGQLVAVSCALSRWEVGAFIQPCAGSAISWAMEDHKAKLSGFYVDVDWATGGVVSPSPSADEVRAMISSSSRLDGRYGRGTTSSGASSRKSWMRWGTTRHSQPQPSLGFNRCSACTRPGGGRTVELSCGWAPN